MHPTLRACLVLTTALAAAAGGVHGQDTGGAAVASPAAAGPFTPVAGPSSPNGPRILRLPSAAPGTVAMRVSVPVREAEIEAGSAQVIAALARARIDGLVAPLGVVAEVTRTPWGIAYSVAGPETDFDYLAYILRELVGLPDLSRVEEARTLLRRDRTRREETGRGRVELRLRTTTAGSTPPLLGTSGSIEAISPSGIRDLWARTHRPERMTLLIAGDVSTPLLLASFAELGTTETVAAAPPSAPVPSGPTADRLDLIRTSIGAAWSVSRPLSPEVAVAAVLLTETLRDADPGFEARVAVWETDGHSVLVLIGAAFPRDVAELRRWADDAPARLAASLDPSRVARIAAELRDEVLLDARTPHGQLRSVGRFVDAGLGAGGFEAYLDALAGMTVADLAAALDEMRTNAPARVEITR